MEREYESVFPFYERSYNVAPTDEVPIVRQSQTHRESAIRRWGLIPYYAKGVAPKGKPLIIARVEQLKTWSGWSAPWKRGQRCILPATGFYEWHLDPQRGKNPYYIHLADQEIFSIAGLWERSVGADGSAVESCALITLPANALMQDIHNTGSNPHRMPAILRRDDWDAWLAGTPQEAEAVLNPYPADLMVAYEVSPRVNSPKCDDEELIRPADLAMPPAGLLL